MLHRNLALKGAALGLAIFLWFWVLLNERSPFVPVPVSTQIRADAVEPGLALNQALPIAKVDVSALKRESSDIGRRVTAFVSCRGLDEGTHTLPVHVRVPENVTIKNVRPGEVAVSLERVVSEARRVELHLTGEPPAGYELIGADSSPEVVRLSGPRGRVDQATHVLATVDLGRALPEVPLSITVVPVDSSGDRVPGLNCDPERVNVAVQMKLVIASRTVPVTVKGEGSLPPDLRLVSVKVEPSMVTIVGPATQVQRISHVETTPLALTRVSRSFRQELMLAVPEGVSLLGERTVRVTIAVEAGASLTPSEGEAAEGEPADSPPAR